MIIDQRYKDVKSGTLSKESFLAEARRDPRISKWITGFTTFDEAVNILKSKSYIFENVETPVKKFSVTGWMKESINDEINEPKGVVNSDSVNAFEYDKGWRYELKAIGKFDDESIQKAQAKAVKNLEKDALHYTKLEMQGEYPDDKGHKDLDVSKGNNLTDQDNQSKPVKVKTGDSTETEEYTKKMYELGKAPKKKSNLNEAETQTKPLSGFESEDEKCFVVDMASGKIIKGFEDVATAVDYVDGLNKGHKATKTTGYLPFRTKDLKGVGLNHRDKNDWASTKDAPPVEKSILDKLRALVSKVVKESSALDDLTKSHENDKNPIVQEDVRFDQFTMTVKKPDYTGTIKRDTKGWDLYDASGSKEEAGPFSTLESLISYYDITKDQLSGDYVKNLREEECPTNKLPGGKGDKSNLAGIDYNVKYPKNEKELFDGHQYKKLGQYNGSDLYITFGKYPGGNLISVNSDEPGEYENLRYDKLIQHPPFSENMKEAMIRAMFMGYLNRNDFDTKKTGISRSDLTKWGNEHGIKDADKFDKTSTIKEEECPTNKIPGGKGDKLSAVDVDQDELAMGLTVEAEHTDDPEVAKEIALDHLAEDPKYYSHMKEAGLDEKVQQLKESIRKIVRAKLLKEYSYVPEPAGEDVDRTELKRLLKGVTWPATGEPNNDKNQYPDNGYTKRIGTEKADAIKRIIDRLGQEGIDIYNEYAPEGCKWGEENDLFSVKEDAEEAVPQIRQDIKDMEDLDPKDLAKKVLNKEFHEHSIKNKAAVMLLGHAIQNGNKDLEVKKAFMLLADKFKK